MKGNGVFATVKNSVRLQRIANKYNWEQGRLSALSIDHEGRRSPAKRSGESGSATVLVVGLVLAAIIVFIAVNNWAQAAAARSLVSGAADAAAVGAAEALQSGLPACSAARVAAQKNRATLGSCQVFGEHVQVSCETLLPLWGVKRSISAVSRAGPES